MKTIVVDIEFEHGELVYRKAATDPCRGMVIAYICTPPGVAYKVRWEDGGMEMTQESTHFGIELTREFVPCFTE
jgi:Cu2+-containing amine oxidase